MINQDRVHLKCQKFKDNGHRVAFAFIGRHTYKIALIDKFPRECFLFDEDEEGTELKLVHHLPYNPLKDLDESELEKMFMENDGIQFSHTIEEQIGGQLKAGFTLTDLFEDYNDYGELAKFIPTFVATRAVKK